MTVPAGGRPPAVSVLLPARDAAATLARALDSVRGQVFPDWELIVVDDHSRDGTGALVAAAAAADPRIRLLPAVGRGLVAALTTGLAAARAPLIARLDADDECHPDRLGEQVAWLDRHPGLGLVGCLVEFAGDRSAQAGYAHHVDWSNTLVSAEDLLIHRFVESPLAHPSVMFRRRLVDLHGGYREGDFPEDYELWLRWLDAGVRMAKVPRRLLRWHDPPQRLSRTDPRYRPEAFFRAKAPWIARDLARRPARPVWVWGAGRPTRQRAAALTEHGVSFAGYIDVDPRKAGRALGGTGLPVIAPEALPPPDQAFVLSYVSVRGARELIAAHLGSRGFVPGRDFLPCA